jgi:hypothetical protein
VTLPATAPSKSSVVGAGVVLGARAGSVGTGTVLEGVVTFVAGDGDVSGGVSAEAVSAGAGEVVVFVPPTGAVLAVGDAIVGSFPLPEGTSVAVVPPPSPEQPWETNAPTTTARTLHPEYTDFIVRAPLLSAAA